MCEIRTLCCRVDPWTLFCFVLAQILVTMPDNNERQLYNFNAQPQQQAASGSRDPVVPMSNPAVEISAVGIRPIKFWAHAPTMWFRQMENSFALANITRELTKFRHVLANLEWNQIKEVEDIIDKEYTSNDTPYSLLKERLIARLSNSENHDIKQMLEKEQLGDRKPSQYLRELQRLARNTVGVGFLKTLWISRLPEKFQTVLATQPSDASLERLGELADAVFDIVPSQEVCQVSTYVSKTAVPKEAVDDPMTALIAQVSALTKQVASLANSNHSNRTRSRSRSKSSSKKPEGWLCRAHYRYGDKANSCKQPCSWQGNTQPGH